MHDHQNRKKSPSLDTNSKPHSERNDPNIDFSSSVNTLLTPDNVMKMQRQHGNSFTRQFIQRRNNKHLKNYATKKQTIQRFWPSGETAELTPTATQVSFDTYKEKFDDLFEVSPYDQLSTKFDPSLDSKGPRTERSRAIFEHLYNQDQSIKDAYDNDVDGIRSQIDTYTAKTGYNVIDSPRLDAIKALFEQYGQPVPETAFPIFLALLMSQCIGLTDDERNAINSSNEWQLLIDNASPTDEQAAQIREVINPPIPDNPSIPTDPNKSPNTPEEQYKKFIANLGTTVEYLDNGGYVDWDGKSPITYESDSQVLRVGLLSTEDNPGQVLTVRAQIMRNNTPIGGPDENEFPISGSSSVAIPFNITAPDPMPKGGDNLSIKVDLMKSGENSLAYTDTSPIIVQPGISYTKAQAIQQAKADQRHLDKVIKSKMIAMGGTAENVVELFNKRTDWKIVPMTVRHDSAKYVAEHGEGEDSNAYAYFFGDTYDVTNIDIPASGTTVHEHKVIGIEVTADVATKTRVSDDAMIETAIHEAMHMLYVPEDNNSDKDRYKDEFNAQWMDGMHDSLPTDFDPSLDPPGPKSQRARAIFDMLYKDPGSWMEKAYDQDIDGFRSFADNYLYPDGINLIASVKLDELQALIRDWDGNNFSAFHSQVMRIAYTLDAQELEQISNNQAWRNLVEDKVPDESNQVTIKTALGIPQ